MINLMPCWKDIFVSVSMIDTVCLMSFYNYLEHMTFHERGTSSLCLIYSLGKMVDFCLHNGITSIKSTYSQTRSISNSSIILKSPGSIFCISKISIAQIQICQTLRLIILQEDTNFIDCARPIIGVY